MKVGMDGVLLGAWVNVPDAGRILDVGTGTGLIAIMLAQRSEALIDAVEIEPEAYLQARENIAACPWNQRIEVYNGSFQLFADHFTARYDLVVSNPPFFRNSLQSPFASRSLARHDVWLSHESLIFNAVRILTDKGRLAVILPAGEFNGFSEQAYLQGLFVTRLLNIKPLPDKDFSRCMVEFSRSRNAKYDEDTLIIRNKDRRTYTDDYIKLTGDFYL
jgi:tRNA1Val (adenine37-N6)-methyltransferase